MSLTSAAAVGLTPVPPAVADDRTGCRITFAVILRAVLAFSLLQTLVLPALRAILLIGAMVATIACLALRTVPRSRQ
jgi:hypothetical protein